MKNLFDTQQRELALDPSQSFIVQAPAGSGKTELLTRRFLKLLSCVEKAPEEILAITFTRKAASEMRSRIIKRLEQAHDESEPNNTNERESWVLAKKALERDQQLNWHLLENPNRLRIQTIDALCNSLTYQMPLLSQFGAKPIISDHAEHLYHKAASALLKQIDDNVEWSEHIKQFLMHLDNNVSTAKELLAKMLAKRDQWLPHLVKSQVRDELENGLLNITQDALERCCATIPRDILEELHLLTQFASENNGPQINPINNLINIKLLSCEEIIKEKENWKNLCALLLTKEDTWRKCINKNNGFPTDSGSKDKIDKALYKALKGRMLDLLTTLRQYEDFRDSLIEVRNAPPITFSEQQWQMLTSLLKLLPIAAAQLKVTFQETNQVDFIEIAQAASTALGSPDCPSDLALILDYKIQHILVDEFQDTSTTQFQLLEQLTTGWQPDDGRTLFVVGDPMQSIYRFRDAQVGLFLRAQHEGIGHITLKPLTLAVNFRSKKPLVEWINSTFINAFPTIEDISAGAVTYHACTTNDDQKNTDATVTIHPLVNANKNIEAQTVIEIIRQQQTNNPDDSIAILVRSRTHLDTILSALGQHNIHYQAVDIDRLETRPIIQDLYALTKALLHPADRIAWLSILRAPWCGLTLNDLHIIANEEPKTIILQRIQDKNVLERLNSDARKRLLKVIPIFSSALEQRQRNNLRETVCTLWESLNGPLCLNNATDLNNVNAYFQLLEQLETAGTLKDFSLLDKKIKSLYSSPDTLGNEKLQVMTIHKSKGLEFDTVIIPGLEHEPQKQDTQLLLWMERPRTHHDSDLILAPIKSLQDDHDPMYRYLAHEEMLKSKYEDCRLLYVATTRAKKQLHLIGNAFTDDQHESFTKPSQGSFLNLIWPAIYADFNNALTQENKDSLTPSIEINSKMLKRLSSNFFEQETPQIIEGPIVDNTNPQNKPLKNSSDIHTAVGTLIHRILEQISSKNIEHCKIQTHEENWKTSLLRLGVLPDQLDASIMLVKNAIHNMLNDAKGRWILSMHKQSYSEFEISTSINNKPYQYIIDRTFVDDTGHRWIIDYKSAYIKNDAMSLQDFLIKERTQHKDQLKTYGGLMIKLFPEPIKYGLYFPIIPAWTEWD